MPSIEKALGRPRGLSSIYLDDCLEFEFNSAQQIPVSQEYHTD